MGFDLRQGLRLRALVSSYAFTCRVQSPKSATPVLRRAAEIWFQELPEARPDWMNELAMPRSSSDRADREIAEQRLRDGSVKCMVCTSSLDPGVDFSPVEAALAPVWWTRGAERVSCSFSGFSKSTGDG